MLSLEAERRGLVIPQLNVPSIVDFQWEALYLKEEWTGVGWRRREQEGGCENSGLYIK